MFCTSSSNFSFGRKDDNGIPDTDETYLMLYTKGSLEPGIYEFDVASKSFKKVESVERADKIYFISLTPKRNTIADVAIENL